MNTITKSETDNSFNNIYGAN